jgi:hypothetical protein
MPGALVLVRTNSPLIVDGPIVGVKDGSGISTGEPEVGVAGPTFTSQAEMSRPVTKIVVKRNLLAILRMSGCNITRFDIIPMG